MKLPIVCPVAGVSFRQDEVSRIRPGHRVLVERDPDNAHDPYACKISCRGSLLGYVPKAVARRLCEGPLSSWYGTVTEVLKGEELTGLRVRIVGGLPPAEEPVLEDEAATRPVVYARSGRRLGILVDTLGDKVLVRTDAGSQVPYPRDLVSCDGSPKPPKTEEGT